LGEIKALFEWVQRNVRYTKDTFRIEVLHSAKRMLKLRAGDCDDMAILLGAMLEAIHSGKTSSAIFIWRSFTEAAGSRWTPPCPTRWAGRQELWSGRYSLSRGDRTCCPTICNCKVSVRRCRTG
jgi:hypothetical protein